ncbi:Hypothetical predicted protein [Olea europaea subsp. europaea]|uniref:Uncharacterized protein n=1 Tax=Olea europaea subsp. europaea TaxID=158383 RepID=A0A8S0QU43_OLEEU|nr:Hypothetical predicted protein [Olea europaea subsp. europaea]
MPRVEVGPEVPEEAGMPGVEVSEEAEIEGVEGRTGVAEEVAEGTSEVVVEGDDQVAEDERTPEMTDDENKLSEIKLSESRGGEVCTGVPTSDRCRPELWL